MAGQGSSASGGVSGRFADPNIPDGEVKVESFNAGGPTTRVWYDPRTWKTQGWILQKRSLNSFERSEVPARANQRIEIVATGRTREMQQDGKCWTECEYVTRTALQRYYLVSRQIEWWRVNMALKEYYDWVTGPATGVTAMGVAGATASAGGRSAMQALGRAAVKGAIGSSIPQAVPTMAAAAPGAITATTGLAAFGLGITIFVGSTHLMRMSKADTVLISRGWEVDWERSGYGPEEEPTESEPRWEICSDIRDCPGDDQGTRERPMTGSEPAGTGVAVPGGDAISVPPEATDGGSDPGSSPAPRGGGSVPVPFGMSLPGALGNPLVLLGAVALLLLPLAILAGSLLGGNDDDAQRAVPGGATQAAQAPQVTPTAVAVAPTPEVVLGPIVAEAGSVVTEYVLSLDELPPLEAISFAWSGATCGTARSYVNRYAWDHREQVARITGGIFGDRELGRSGDCDHQVDPTHGNPLIVADVTGESFTARCTFQGAGSGTGPHCDITYAPQPPAAPPPPPATPASGSTVPSSRDPLDEAIAMTFAGGVEVPFRLFYSEGSCAPDSFLQQETLQGDPSANTMTMGQGQQAPSGAYPSDHSTELIAPPPVADTHEITFALDANGSLMFEGSYRYEGCSWHVRGSLE